MVPEVVAGVGVQQRAQRAAVDDQPRDERAELLGREQVDLEHGRHVRADRLVPDLVDAELGDWGGGLAGGLCSFCVFFFFSSGELGYGRTFSSYALPELGGELELGCVGLVEVDVHVETTAAAVVDGVWEGGVGLGFLGGGWVDEGFAIFGAVAGAVLIKIRRI